MNIGLGCFSGKYFARMDADDIAKPSWIEKIVTYLEKNDHITAMGSYLEIIVEKNVELSVLNIKLEIYGKIHCYIMIFVKLCFSIIRYITTL